MAARRRVPPPSLVCNSRSTLATQFQPDVDALLKRLRTCTRRLRVVLASHRTELQVLERLYYKGKNQHRTALFWQRVAEMRRYGGRVEEMHLWDVVESLRLSFWGEASERTSKLLKGPWTKYPDASSILYVLERCSSCCTLIDKTQERLLSVYQAFNLMMQTSAFLQLIVTLSAIASRLSTLLLEARGALDIAWSAAYCALQVLHPSDLSKVVRPLQTAELQSIPASTAPSAMVSSHPSQAPTPRYIPEEDLGDTVARHPQTISDSTGTVTLNTVQRSSTPGEQAATPHMTFTLSSELEASVSGSCIQFKHVAQEVTAHARVSSPPPIKPPKRKKDAPDRGNTVKKKKKRDEIDDIFGF
ncbi:uncharacterized protein BXZ73DRAFT_37079 [Epithele typhae]|uniref:uncharacterized protein n=1 Tax=Epithele typhae TaxID=378194 RepID=UPI002008C07D|nr:uncharacterized protein BXZ73DRAFT_37079 [Epithele typhae]KAH9946177.1 hypothetical protein BXZ73DRAFT_37079 [Epithele typhae]